MEAAGHRLGPRWWAAYVLAVLLLSALSFHGYLGLPFDVDDHFYLHNSEEISGDWTRIAHPSFYPGRPLVHLVFWSVYEAWGVDPLPYHGLCVILHAAAAVLVTLLAQRLGMGGRLSAVGGILFLVNVAHFRAIQWVSAMAYPMALGLGVFSVIAFLKYRDEGGTLWLGVSGTVLALAVLAHPAIAPIWPFVAVVSWDQEGVRKRWLVPWLAVGMLGRR